MPRSTVVIWNSRAGKAEASIAVRDELGIRPGIELVEASQREDVIARTQAAAEDGAERILVAGGDGTVSAGIQGLLQSGRNLPIGIIPVGTGNDFCRTLALPLNPAEAVAWFESAESEAIDIVEMADEDRVGYFINMATAGNSDRVIDQITEEEKQAWGPLSYLRGALDVARDLIPYSLSIQIDSEPPEVFTTWNVILANGRTSGGGVPVAPTADPTDGKLDLIVVRTGSLPNLVEIGIRLWMDTVLESNLIEHRQATTVKVQADPPMRFTADGDLVERNPVSFKVLPRAVRMLVGPEFRQRIATSPHS